jgi:hypothetical protein
MIKNTIQIEGLSTNLRGGKHLVLRTAGSKLPDLADFIGGGEAFQKYVLLTGKGADPISQFWLPWSSSFMITDQRDWSMALTYLTNAQKPLFCLADQSIQIPEAFLRRLAGQNITFIHVTVPTAALATSMALPHYDSIFVAPVEDINSTFYESALTVIQRSFTRHRDYEMKDVLKELNVANAGLVWTRLQESDPGGAVYWYEPGGVSHKLMISQKQIGAMLRAFGDSL